MKKKSAEHKKATFWPGPQAVVSAIALLFLLAGLVLQIQPASIQPQGSVPQIQTTPPQTVALIPHAAVPAVDCGAMSCLALTFDDGPNPITTPQILTILEQEQVHASFFVVGSRAVTMPGILQRMYRDGDEIGNHSWSHPDLTTLTPGQIQAQVNDTQAAVMAAGVPAPSLFRPPYGAVNAKVLSNVPLAIAMWNVDPLDWKDADPNVVARNIVAAARPGRVVDLHDIYPQTAGALRAVIEQLKPHYQLVTMSHLFNLAPGQRGEFFGR
jgi:peptidoglycan/xylan/chitin deacetylase (PgdA/CDA1 family)